MNLLAKKRWLLGLVPLLALVAVLLLGELTNGPVRAQGVPTPTPTPTQRVTIQSIPLHQGFNNIAALWPPDSPVTKIAAAVDPPGALINIWKYDASQARWMGFAPQAPQASDLQTAGLPDALWFNVGQEASIKIKIDCVIDDFKSISCTITLSLE